MKKNRMIYYLGNLLMLLSFAGFIYIFLPVIWIYLMPPKPPIADSLVKKEFFISIPRINAYSDVIKDTDPWNESVYKDALKKGVAHARGSYLPGEKHTIFLFAHSSGTPWEITHTNTVFLRLNELTPGDLIYLKYNLKSYTYKVSKKEEVLPTRTEYLTQLQEDKLILQTCTPIGTSLRRLLIFADPV